MTAPDEIIDPEPRWAPLIAVLAVSGLDLALPPVGGVLDLALHESDGRHRATQLVDPRDVGLGAVLDVAGQPLDSERAVAYRRQQGVRDDGLAMAVVVQQLVSAEVAGVLFTRDPLDASGGQMLVEAAWGLGESVVSGALPEPSALVR